mgnify:CR=1 FL=1
MNEILKTKIGRILLIIILVGMILLANLFFKQALIKQHLPLLTLPDEYSTVQLRVVKPMLMRVLILIFRLS